VYAQLTKTSEEPLRFMTLSNASLINPFTQPAKRRFWSFLYRFLLLISADKSSQTTVFALSTIE
jgi:hypothetical protein